MTTKYKPAVPAQPASTRQCPRHKIYFSYACAHCLMEGIVDAQPKPIPPTSAPESQPCELCRSTTRATWCPGGAPHGVHVHQGTIESQTHRPTWAQDDVWGYVSQLEAENAGLKRQLAAFEPVDFMPMIREAERKGWNEAVSAAIKIATTLGPFTAIREIRALAKGESNG